MQVNYYYLNVVDYYQNENLTFKFEFRKGSKLRQTSAGQKVCTIAFYSKELPPFGRYEYSVSSEKDQFVKRIGRQIAFNRLVGVAQSPDIINWQPGFAEALDEFLRARMEA
jgi:hypothetical protein